MSKPKIMPPARQRESTRYAGVPHAPRRAIVAQVMRLRDAILANPDAEGVDAAKADLARGVTYLQATAMPGTRAGRNRAEASARQTKAEIKRTRRQLRGDPDGVLVP